MDTITKAEFDAAREADGYYAGRWPYMERVCRIVAALPDWPPEQVLELGPYRLPIVPGCHTIDRLSLLPSLTRRLDARRTPWPFADAAYELFIALQVWEHLEGCQRACWAEVRRVARRAILSVPWRWPERYGGHAGIDIDTIRDWTGGDPDRCIVIPGLVGGHVLERAVLYWADLAAAQESPLPGDPVVAWEDLP